MKVPHLSPTLNYCNLANIECDMKLNSIDNMRIDGKFYIGSDIPEGQGSVNSLLAECYELAYDLRAAVDEDKEDRGE